MLPSTLRRRAVTALRMNSGDTAAITARYSEAICACLITVKSIEKLPFGMHVR